MKYGGWKIFRLLFSNTRKEIHMSESLNSDAPQLPPSTIAHNLKIVNLPGTKYPFAYRPVDAPIVKWIFQDEEYKLPIKNFQPKLILDCGGNIGCSAVYFANQYPDAQIYSMEPEANNFKLLQYNTTFYDNVHIMKSALWDKETFIRVEDRGHGIAGFMTFETTEDDPESFKTVTIAKLLKDSGFDKIDFLKVDIEGAEKEVFGAADVDEWLPKVSVIAIELHDRYKRGCSYEFFKAISKYHWYFAFKGENLFFIREND